MEIEKKGKKGLWDEKLWLCKLCYEDDNPKALAATATSSCISHLYNHSVYPSGCSLQSEGSSISSFVDLQCPPHQQAERWRNAFINWIAAMDIIFEQAATAPPRVIVNGGSHANKLLPNRNTVRNWVMNSYNERLDEVKEQLANSSSRITLSLDGCSPPNSLSMLEGFFLYIVRTSRPPRAKLIDTPHARYLSGLLFRPPARQPASSSER